MGRDRLPSLDPGGPAPCGNRSALRPPPALRAGHPQAVRCLVTAARRPATDGGRVEPAPAYVDDRMAPPRKARYQVLASSLPTNVAAQVRDVITCPAPTYSRLTSALRERLAHSRSSRLEALLRNQQLGDQRPSQLLRRMQGELTAAGDSPADSGLLRTLFLQRLPQGVTATLSLLPENTALDELASSADRIMEASRPAIYPAAVSAIQPTQLLPAPAPAPAAHATDLLATVASLTATVSELQMEVRAMRQERTHDRPQQSCNRCRSQSRGRQRWSRPDRSPSRPRDELCYFHHRSGAQAKKCRSPCSWMAPTGNETV